MTAAAIPNEPAAELDTLFAFEELGEDRFRLAPGPLPLLRLYGGQVVAQALAAAQRTVSAGRLAHSCHAYFVRPGGIDRPIDFTVARDSDGRSFSARRVTAEQDGRLILTLSASMQTPEKGPRHQAAMPDVPAPETLRAMDDLIEQLGDQLPPRHWPFWRRRHLFDWRSAQPFHPLSAPAETGARRFWFRLRGAPGDDAAVHQSLLAYASDLHILHAGLAPLGIGWADDHLQTASLDHSIWFHDRFRVDEWLLYEVDSAFAGSARALGRGLIFAADGRLVASVAQEGLIRLLAEPRGHML